MKVFGVFIVGGLLLVPVFYAAFAAGVRIGIRRAQRQGIRAIGLTPDAASRHRDAMRLLNRLINVTDLDGIAAGDIISSQTRRDIERIVNDCRREITT